MIKTKKTNKKGDIFDKWGPKHEKSIKTQGFVFFISLWFPFFFLRLQCFQSRSRSSFLRKHLRSYVLMLHHSHVDFTPTQTAETSACWYDIMRRFQEDYRGPAVECTTRLSGGIIERVAVRAPEPHSVLTVKSSFALLFKKCEAAESQRLFYFSSTPCCYNYCSP